MTIGRPIQDYVVFGTMQTPGRAFVRGAGTPRKWDERDGYGMSGASLVFTGNKLSAFEVHVFAWEDAHFVQWELLARTYLVKSPPGIPPRAVGIAHPILVTPPLNITQVAIEDVTQWEQDDDDLWACTIKLKEYRAAMLAFGKAGPGIPAADPEVPTVADAADAQIAALTAQLQALAGAP